MGLNYKQINQTAVIPPFAVNYTYSATELLSGFIKRITSASVDDFVPTAADIVAAIPKFNDTFQFIFSNQSSLASGANILLRSNTNSNVEGNNNLIRPTETVIYFSIVTQIVPNPVVEIRCLGRTQDVILQITDTQHSDISNAARLIHDLTAPNLPSVGIGTGLEFITQTTAGDETGMILANISTNIGSGTEAFDFVVKLMAGGATASEVMRSISNGSLKIAGSQLYRSIPAASIVDPNSVLYPIEDMLSGLIQSADIKTDQVPTAVDIMEYQIVKQTILLYLVYLTNPMDLMKL